MKAYVIQETGEGGKVWRSEWDCTSCAVFIAEDEIDARQQFLDHIGNSLFSMNNAFNEKMFTCEEINTSDRGLVCIDRFLI